MGIGTANIFSPMNYFDELECFVGEFLMKSYMMREASTFFFVWRRIIRFAALFFV